MHSRQWTENRHTVASLSAGGALVFGIATILAACGGDDGNNATPTPVASTTVSATPSGSPTPVPSPVTTEAGIALGEFVIRPEVTRARPGTIIFKVRNEGTVAHQFVVIRSDVPPAQLPRRENNQGADDKQFDVVDKIETIAAGASAELRVPVEAPAELVELMSKMLVVRSLVVVELIWVLESLP